MMDEIGLEIVEGEEVVDAHAGPEGSREEESAIRGPLVVARGEGLSGAEFGERDSVPDVKVAGKLAKSTTHENSALRTPDDFVARFSAKMAKCLAFAIIESRFGGILTISHSKVIALGVPANVVNGTLFISSDITLTLSISRQIVEIGVTVVVVGARLITLGGSKDEKRLTTIVPLEGNIITIVETLGRNGLRRGERCEKVDRRGLGFLRCGGGGGGLGRRRRRRSIVIGIVSVGGGRGGRGFRSNTSRFNDAATEVRFLGRRRIKRNLILISLLILATFATSLIVIVIISWLRLFVGSVSSTATRSR